MPINKDNTEFHKKFSDSMRKTLEGYSYAITISPHIFKEIITTLKHAQIFISTKQKMHPDGINLHKDLITILEDIGKEEED